jgi:hypothetical protein
MRVIQGGGRARFALEPLDRLRIGGELGRKELQRDAAAQANVLGLIDDTHSAAAEELDHAVMRNGLADHGLVISIIEGS